jgi:hypothetical protein
LEGDIRREEAVLMMVQWPEEGYEPEEVIPALKRLGEAIIEGTAHKGNGEWLVRFAEALSEACLTGALPVLGEATRLSQASYEERQGWI